MKKLLLTLMLIVLSSSAIAEWVYVGVYGGNKNEYTLYADPATIRKSDNIVKMWDLGDYKKAQWKSVIGKTYMSVVSQSEYNCKEEKSRTPFSIAHSKSMGKGDTVSTYNGTDKWVPTSLLNSNKEALWKIACEK